LRILAGDRQIYADVMRVELMEDEDASIIIVEMGLLFLDEGDAMVAAGQKPWRVIFDKAHVSDGERMLKGAMGRGRAVTLEEVVAEKMMGISNEGAIEIKSLSLTPPRPQVALPMGSRPLMFHNQDECEVQIRGWFPAKMEVTDAG